MPTSHTGQINTIVDLITTINPQSVLDIGIGHGKYGFLSREYLDAANEATPYGNRQVRIDGIEGFPKYITPLQKAIYDNIYIGNALQVIDTINNHYDLILLMDVFEHFTKEDGEALLKKCLAKSKFVLISCPKDMDEQGANHGNEFERHRFQWRKKHFSVYNTAFIPNYYSLICLIGDGAEKVKSTWRSKDLKIRIGAAFPTFRRLYLKLTGKE